MQSENSFLKFKVAESCLTLCNSMGCSLPGSFVRGDSPGKNTGVGCHALLQGDLPKPGIERRPPTFRVDSLLSEPPGKPKNTALGSLPLLQGNFPTQKSNPGLLNCWQILYHLSHQESPRILEWVAHPFSRGSSRPRNQIGVDSLPAELPGKHIYVTINFGHTSRYAGS